MKDLIIVLTLIGAVFVNPVTAASAFNNNLGVATQGQSDFGVEQIVLVEGPTVPEHTFNTTFYPDSY